MLTDQEIEAVFGFNPAPGSPGVMWDLQHRVASRATTLTQAADGLDRVSADSWMGHGADSFQGTLHNLRRDVRTAAGAHTDYASALYAYVSEQESAKTQAQSLAEEALAARQAHTAALSRNDHARAAAVQSELDGLVRRAQALQAHMDEVAGQAARRIDAAAERAPYAPPGWLEQAWDGIRSAAEATWHFVTSPEFLHGLSTVLSVVSAVCAFIPGLQGVALVAAALSIVTDVLAQVAAGQPINWLGVGLGAALVFIPGGSEIRAVEEGAQVARVASEGARFAEAGVDVTRSARTVEGATGTADEVLKRLGTSYESAARLERKAAEAALNPRFGHGVSVTAGQVADGAGVSTALRSDVERYFEVRNTPTFRDPLHRTVILPEPVTKDVADLFNRIFGRVR